MRSDVVEGLAYTLIESNDEPLLVDAHRVALAPIVEDIPCTDYHRDLRNAFVTVDWLFRSVVALSLDQLGWQHANEVRQFSELVDAYHALCAKELCTPVVRLAPQLKPLVEEVAEAIEELVWADAAVASRSGRAHPLAPQVERYASSHAFSDPLDIGYLERTGNAAGRAVREALALGIPLDRMASELRELWARLQNS